MRLPAGVAASARRGEAYDYIVKAFYVKDDGRKYLYVWESSRPVWTSLGRLVACRFLPVNLSPTPIPGRQDTGISVYFSSSPMVKDFVIRMDRNLHYLDTPYHVFYCTESYEGRQNPNNALTRLTRKVSVPFRWPWYGTILAFKFATRDCCSYLDVTVADAIALGEYFAYFA